MQDPRIGVKKSLKTLSVENESTTITPWDEVEEIFLHLEPQVAYISYNMSILMASLENNFGPFGELGISNSEV